MQELTWLLLNNFDFNGASSSYLEDRCLFLELVHPDPEKQACQNLLPPRVIKTHLYYKTLERAFSNGNPKVIVVLRNPKDVLVSFYHFYRANKSLGCYTGTWDEFFELFKNDELLFGVWKDHVLGWWNNREKSNYHFVKYEDMKKRPLEVVTNLANFLDVKADKEDLERVVHHTSFNEMKENKMTNREWWPTFDASLSKFMRKGIIGDWKNYFSKEQSSYVDKICQEMSRNGLDFEFE